jgi:hypothetical protein
MNVMLKVEDMIEAGKSLMECVLRDELEDSDSEYYENVEWVDAFEHVNQQEMLAVIARIVGQIDQAWGEDVGMVFHYMGLKTIEEKGDALYYLIMPCLGHGVSLSDNYSELLKQAENKLSKKFDDSPIYLSSPFSEVVYEAITKALDQKELNSTQ